MGCEAPPREYSKNTLDRRRTRILNCWTRMAVIGVILLPLTPATMGAQALNEAFLRSAVLITFEIEGTPNPQRSVGTGFFLFRPVKADQGHVLLITNKHVLPPTGTPKSIQIRVTIGTGEKAAVRFVDVPIVGTNGKYMPTVRLHPHAGFDVAAVTRISQTSVGNSKTPRRLPIWSWNIRVLSANSTAPSNGGVSCAWPGHWSMKRFMPSSGPGSQRYWRQPQKSSPASRVAGTLVWYRMRGVRASLSSRGSEPGAG